MTKCREWLLFSIEAVSACGAVVGVPVLICYTQNILSILAAIPLFAVIVVCDRKLGDDACKY